MQTWIAVSKTPVYLGTKSRISGKEGAAALPLTRSPATTLTVVPPWYDYNFLLLIEL